MLTWKANRTSTYALLRENCLEAKFGTNRKCMSEHESKIQTTIGMDVLRCQTPEMVRKEILMHFIEAFNERGSAQEQVSC